MPTDYQRVHRTNRGGRALRRALGAALILLYGLSWWEFELLPVGPVRLTDSELIIGLVVGLYALKLLYERRLPCVDRPMAAALLLVGLAMAASSLAGDYHRDLALKYTVRYFAVMALTVALSDLFRDGRVRRLALRTLFGATLVIAALGLVEHFFYENLNGFFALFKSSRFIGTDISANLSYSSGAFWEDQRLIVRASSVFVYCNSLAYFLVMVIFFILYLIGDERARQRTPFRLIGLGFCLYVLTLTFSRGAFATLLISLALCGLIGLARFRSTISAAVGLRRQLGWTAAVLAALLLINLGFFARIGSNFGELLALASNGGIEHEARADADRLALSLERKLALRDIELRGDQGLSPTAQDAAWAGRFELRSPDASPMTFETGGSLFSRVQLWKAAWRLFLRHPWLGVGPDNYRMLFHSELQRFNYDLYISKGIYRPHNLLLNFLAEGGVAGGLTLLLFFAALARLAWRMWRRPLFEPRHVALLGALFVYLITNTFDVLSFDYYSDSVLIATMIALLGVESRGERGSSNLKKSS
ncbi:MAG: O-antigen ligase family protein [Candidatus Alcyoniella australis]|nr:O-antigen ligase family protein [Candidatus Alcyoniella australis]